MEVKYFPKALSAVVKIYKKETSVQFQSKHSGYIDLSV